MSEIETIHIEIPKKKFTKSTRNPSLIRKRLRQFQYHSKQDKIEEDNNAERKALTNSEMASMKMKKKIFHSLKLCPKCGSSSITKFMNEYDNKFIIRCQTLQKQAEKDVDCFLNGKESFLWIANDDFEVYEKKILDSICKWSIHF